MLCSWAATFCIEVGNPHERSPDAIIGLGRRLGLAILQPQHQSAAESRRFLSLMSEIQCLVSPRTKASALIYFEGPMVTVTCVHAESLERITTAEDYFKHYQPTLRGDRQLHAFTERWEHLSNLIPAPTRY